MTEEETAFRAAIRQEKRDRKAAVRAFARSIVSGSPAEISAAIRDVDYTFVWPQAMRAAARGPGLDNDRRLLMLEKWTEGGDHIRQETANDLLLVAAFRKILPPYEGPSLTLFRGESWRNRRHRSYGLSWSMEREVALQFAEGHRDNYQDGTCLLQATAPAGAIVCAPHLLRNGYEEDEYMVDRRLLQDIRVLDRFKARRK